MLLFLQVLSQIESKKPTLVSYPTLTNSLFRPLAFLKSVLFFSTQLRFVSVLLLSLILTGYLNIDRQSVAQLPQLPQDPLIEVYFNQSQASTYTESTRQQTRSGDNLEEIIVGTIANATSSVDVAVQELRLPGIAQALVERHQAGIEVRIIIENNYNRSWGSLTEFEVTQLSEREQERYREFFHIADYNMDGYLSQDEINSSDALIMLTNAGVPLIDDTADGSRGSGLMHHKFVVVDGKTIIVTSANFTNSGIHGDFLNL